MGRENRQMKKVYTKPDVVFENFSLSTNITSCEVHANADRGICGCDFIPGLTLFTNTIMGCDLSTEDGAPEYDGICYHNPSDFNNVFKS